MVALTDNINYLQPSGFKVIMDRKFYPNLVFFATSFIHPSTGLQPSYAPRSRADIRFAGDKLTFGEVQLNIILDEDMHGFTEVYNWMEEIVNVERTPMSARTDTQRSTECDMSVMVLNNKNNTSKEIVYRDAIPTSLGDISFDTASGDNFITVPVSLAFTSFTIR